MKISGLILNLSSGILLFYFPVPVYCYLQKQGNSAANRSGAEQRADQGNNCRNTPFPAKKRRHRFTDAAYLSLIESRKTFSLSLNQQENSCLRSVMLYDWGKYP